MQKYFINGNDYINIKTKYHSYLLGYMWADGYIRKPESNRKGLQLCLVTEDYNQIKNIFDYIGQWKIYNEFPKNKKEVTRLEIHNNIFREFLIENDYLIKSKVGANKILSKIPLQFKHYWWRGYFDGDGCISTTGKNSYVNFTSSYSQDWNFVADLFNQLNLKYHIVQKSKNNNSSSYIKVWRKIDIINFRNFLYPQIYDFGLKRKYDKLEIIQYKRKSKYSNL